MYSTDPLNLDPTRVLQSALATMANVDRTAIALHYLQGMTFEEIASVLRTTPKGARTRTRRALVKLRMRLAGHGLDLEPPAIVRELTGESAQGGSRLGGVVKWVRRRATSKSRAFAEELVTTMGLGDGVDPATSR